MSLHVWLEGLRTELGVENLEWDIYCILIDILPVGITLYIYYHSNMQQIALVHYRLDNEQMCFSWILHFDQLFSHPQV